MPAETNSPAPTRILLLEDNVEDGSLIVDTLATAEMSVETEQVRSLEEFEHRLSSNAYDLILCDFVLRGCNSLDVLRWVRQSGRDTPFIYFSGTFWGDIASDCIREGATDYVRKSDLSRFLRQSQKLEAVGRLAGGIAHDFNNMLGVIMGYCDLAAGRANLQRIENDVAQIRKAAQRAAALTSYLLAFGRQQVLRPSVFNLNTVVSDTLQMLSRVIGADVDLTFCECSNIGPVKADLGQLEQVLLNLVLNSCDAMPHGGTILIETAEVELDASYAKFYPGVRTGRYVRPFVSGSVSCPCYDAATCAIGILV